MGFKFYLLERLFLESYQVSKILLASHIYPYIRKCACVYCTKSLRTSHNYNVLLDKYKQMVSISFNHCHVSSHYTVVHLDLQIVLGLFVLLLHFWDKRKVLKFVEHCFPLVVGKPKWNKTKQLEKLRKQGKAVHKYVPEIWVLNQKS